MANFKNFEFHAWAEFEHTLFTGETAFVHHFGKSYFEWLAANPDANARFDRQMERRTAALLSLATPLIEHLPETGLLVDVGGGNGYFLASILRSRPALSGILLDQPQVIAAAAKVFAEAGVTDRARAEGGDFFRAVPPGADVYTMLSVLHDWDDTDALRILKRVREAMRDGSRLLIGDAVLCGPNEWDTFKNIDLHMLVNIGGRERSEEDWRSLLGRANFGSVSITRSPTLSCIAASGA
jgi:SAM-dependent methyltransferase